MIDLLTQAENNNSERNGTGLLVFIAVCFQNISYISPNEYPCKLAPFQLTFFRETERSKKGKTPFLD